MKKYLFLIVVFLISTLPIQAESIYSLIINGKLKEASDSLSLLTTASLRNGNNLFYRSLIEPNASKAAQLMEAALNTSVATTHQEEIYLRLAQYYFISHDYQKLQNLIADYRAMWEHGKYYDQMLRYSIVVDQRNGEYESALRQADRYLLTYTEKSQQQWGKIDKARIMLNSRKRIGADKILRSVSKSKSGPGVPQALFMLTLESIKRDRVDDAVFYYNLLREAYPLSVGLDELVDHLADMSTDDNKEHEADKLTGTFYSVKVGVFSKKGNAKKQANLFKKYGYKVETKTKIISNKKYRVVYVGRFKTFDEAAVVKKKLEALRHEPYQVIAR